MRVKCCQYAARREAGEVMSCSKTLSDQEQRKPMKISEFESTSQARGSTTGFSQPVYLGDRGTHTHTRLHGVTSHKTGILLFGVVTISNLYKSLHFFLLVAEEISCASYSEKRFRKSVEKMKIHISCSIFFPPENRAVYGKIW